jgi:cytochrome c biogenesis protein CcmG, thiol:disulfide interchange protein DsbE
MSTDNISPDSGDHDEARTEATTAPRRRMSKRSIIIFVTATVLNGGLLFLLAWQLLTPAHPQSNGGNGSYTPSDPLKGKAAPNFTLAALSDKHVPPISLAQYKGKAIVLNFWASWCGPCQDEAALLQNEWQKVQSKNIVFLGVDFQDTQTDGMIFVRKYHITYPSVQDTTGAIAINYGIAFTPTTIFINSQGIVVNNVPQQITAQQLQQNVQSLLKQSG